MTKFKGFPPGKPNSINIHAQFITQVVPMIDDLAELKICLFCYFALLQKEGDYRYLTRADFANNTELIRGLEVIDENTDALLDAALEKASEHGFLLAADVELDKGSERLYFMNTAKGRTAIQQFVTGRWQIGDERSIEILPERPNIFTLYEENIGALTPAIAERLKEAEDDYAYEWIEEAINIAIDRNVRNWKYIDAILKRWKEEGRFNSTAKESSVAQIYRENIDYEIGTIIKEKLQAAEKDYSSEWIADAIEIAVENNAKSWRYVRAILEDWKQHGRQNETPKRHNQRDNPFAGLKWSDFAE